MDEQTQFLKGSTQQVIRNMGNARTIPSSCGFGHKLQIKGSARATLVQPAQAIERSSLPHPVTSIIVPTTWRTNRRGTSYLIVADESNIHLAWKAVNIRQGVMWLERPNSIRVQIQLFGDRKNACAKASSCGLAISCNQDISH